MHLAGVCILTVTLDTGLECSYEGYNVHVHSILKPTNLMHSLIVHAKSTGVYVHVYQG